jgi:hypothetical protein
LFRCSRAAIISLRPWSLEIKIGGVELVLGIAGRVHHDLLAHGTLLAPVSPCWSSAQLCSLGANLCSVENTLTEQRHSLDLEANKRRYP